jgi:TRAP-type C4-dicarboxylate transport system permease small subunit
MKAFITKTNYILAVIAAYVVFLSMFIMTADVTARFFQVALPGTVELVELFLAIMIFLGWSYTQEQGGHIAIDLVYRRLPKNFQRLLTLLHPVFGLVLMVIFCRQGYKFALYSRSGGEITENLNLPLWPFKLLIVVGAAAFCLQLIMEFIQALQQFRKKKD